MQTLDITFEKNYHTSLEDRFLMEKIIIHKSVDIGEDAQQVLDKARQEAELNHRRNNPKLYPDAEVSIAPVIEASKYHMYKEAGLSQDEIIAREMATCKELKVLESYKFIVKGKPDLETIYQSKLKELQ